MTTKNQSFYRRLGYALQGIGKAWQHESSFRVQILSGGAGFGLLFLLRPEPIWWAMFFLATGAVLAAELLNTALEGALDRLHPEIHPAIALAKDCSAAAVLVLSFAAIGILGALLFQSFILH